MLKSLFSLLPTEIVSTALANSVNALYFDVMPTHIAAIAKSFPHPNAGQTAWIFLTSHLAFDIKSIAESYGHAEVGGCVGFAFKYTARNSFKVDNDGFSPFIQGIFGCLNGYSYVTGHNYIMTNTQEHNRPTYEYMVPATIESSETMARIMLTKDLNNFYDFSLQVYIAGLKGVITPICVTTYTKLTYGYVQEMTNDSLYSLIDFLEQ